MNQRFRYADSSGVLFDLPSDTDCTPKVAVKALVTKGENPGRSSYQKKLKIFLDKGVYYFSFLLAGEGVGDEYYRSGTVKMPTPPGGIFCHDDSCNIFFVTERPSVNLSLQNVTAEITGTDSFTLQGCSIPELIFFK